jgi:hypothetical protein
VRTAVAVRDQPLWLSWIFWIQPLRTLG